jgi:hypothetical protein
MRESQVTDENGKISILMPADFELRGNANANWRLDFPKPEGLQLNSTVDVGDNSLEYTYMGEGVDAAAYLEYCKALVADGYTRVSENEIEESQFAIYENEDEGISLYVTYNAYKYAADTEYAYAEPTLRVVASPLDSVTLPGADLLSPQSYNKVTDSAITAIELPAKSSGTGYVISLEDGRFVVLDGGAVLTGEEADNFWNLISDLNQKHSGEPTSAQNPVRVAAWFISHSHGDHYGLFEKISKTHGKTDLVLEY